MLVVIEVILATIITIAVGSLDWHIVRGNRLVAQVHESLEEMRRQQNTNSETLLEGLTELLNRISEDVERAANNDQGLRDSLIKVDTVLADLRQINIQLLTRIEVLDRKVENGNGRGHGIG